MGHDLSPSACDPFPRPSVCLNVFLSGVSRVLLCPASHSHPRTPLLAIPCRFPAPRLTVTITHVTLCICAILQAEFLFLAPKKGTQHPSDRRESMNKMSGSDTSSLHPLIPDHYYYNYWVLVLGGRVKRGFAGTFLETKTAWNQKPGSQSLIHTSVRGISILVSFNLQYVRALV